MTLAEQHGLANMAAAYQQLQDQLGPVDADWLMQPEPNPQPPATAAQHGGGDAGFDELLVRSVAAGVFDRLWRKLQIPVQRQRLVPSAGGQ
jgi:hypothetical protein